MGVLCACACMRVGAGVWVVCAHACECVWVCVCMSVVYACECVCVCVCEYSCVMRWKVNCKMWPIKTRTGWYSSKFIFCWQNDSDHNNKKWRQHLAHAEAKEKSNNKTNMCQLVTTMRVFHVKLKCHLKYAKQQKLSLVQTLEICLNLFSSVFDQDLFVVPPTLPSFAYQH